jgi:hypothetical protein
MRLVQAARAPQGWRRMSGLAHRLGPRAWQRITAILAAVLLAGMLAACSGSRPARTAAARTVTVTKDFTVALPSGDHPRITASSKGSEAAGRHRDSDQAPARQRPLAAQRHRCACPGSAPDRLRPAAGRRSHPQLPHPAQQCPSRSSPFLASLDTTTGKWVPVPSTYDAATGVVSARVTHFSIWAPLSWIKSAVAAVLKGALEACSTWPAWALLRTAA